MRRLLLLFAVLFISAPGAEAANIYELKDISVTVSGADAAKLRDQAISEAEKKAFDELQKKLVTGGYIPDARNISAAQISAAVDSLDIVSEKIGAKDYHATYNILFSTIEISRIFSIGEIQPVEDPDKYLVVPIISEGGELKIWKNDWLKNWGVQKHDDIIIPLGDLQDVQNLKSEDLTTKKYEGAFRLEKRYGANNIVLVTAEYSKDKNALAVKLEKIKDHERTTISYEYPSTRGVKITDLYEAAANDITYRLENNKLTDNSLVVDAKGDASAPKVPEPYSPMAPGTGYVGEKKYPVNSHSQSTAEPHPFPQQPSLDSPPKTMTADDLPPLVLAHSAPAAKADNAGSQTSDITVVAPDLIAWGRIRNKITATAGISNLQIKSLIGGKAHITVSYNDDVQSMSSALAASGLVLTGSSGNLEIREKP